MQGAGFVDITKSAVAEFADDGIVLDVSRRGGSTFRESLVSMRSSHVALLIKTLKQIPLINQNKPKQATIATQRIQ